MFNRGPSEKTKQVAACNHGFPKKVFSKGVHVRTKRTKASHRDTIRMQALVETFSTEMMPDVALGVIMGVLEFAGTNKLMAAFEETIRKFEELAEIRKYRAERQPVPQDVEWAPLSDVDENGVRYFNYGQDEIKATLERLRNARRGYYRQSENNYNRFQNKLRQQEDQKLVKDYWKILKFRTQRKFDNVLKDKWYHVLVPASRGYSGELRFEPAHVLACWNKTNGREDRWGYGKSEGKIVNRQHNEVAEIGETTSHLCTEAMLVKLADLIRHGNLIHYSRNHTTASSCFDMIQKANELIIEQDVAAEKALKDRLSEGLGEKSDS